MTIKEYRNKINELLSRSADLNEILENEGVSPRELYDGISKYLGGALPALRKVMSYSNQKMIEVGGRIYHVKHKGAKREYAPEEFVKESKSAIGTINASFKLIKEDKSNYPFFFDYIGEHLVILYQIQDQLKEILDETYIGDFARVELIKKEREKILKECIELEDELQEYLSAPKNASRVTIDDCIEGNPFVDNRIIIGETGEELDDDTKELIEINEIKYVPKGEEVALSYDTPNLFLETDKELLSEDYYDLILENIIHEAFLHFKAKGLQVAFIEDKINSPVLKPIMNNLSLGVSSSLSFYNEVANDESSASRLINLLFNEYNDRISKFKSFRALSSTGRCDNIYDYNKENPTEPVSFIFFIYKDFPSFSKNEDERRMLIKILEGGRNAGIFTLLIGNNIDVSQKYSSDLKISKLDLAKLNIPLISVKRNEVMMGNVPFVFKEKTFNTNYYGILKKRMENSDKFYVDEILEEEKETPYYQRIKIPVGESNGRKVYFETATEAKPYPFSIVTGSTGSGKSAFLHTLMMSAAYKYSPREIEIHLVDFKSADKSTDFDGYRYVPGKENLYIPHVKYISLKSRPENAIDVTNYIINLMAERSRYGKFEEYNRRVEPEKRIPQIYVIIDEYENMIKGGDGLDDDSIEKINLVSQINTNIETILKRARVFGIGVIFAGQDFTLKGKAPNQINTRFAFFNSESTLRASFPDSIDNFSKFPSDKKQSVGYCYVGSEGDTNPQYTHIAYAGGVESERLHRLAKKIREKYPEETKKHEQTIIGGTGYVIPEKGSYLDWDDEIAAMIESTKMSYDSDEEFYSSGSKDSIELFRPLALGQSSSSKMTVSINYAFDSRKLAYFACASKQGLVRIEVNSLMAFFYQTRKMNYQKPRIIYLDASFDGMKDEIIDEYKQLNPYLEKEIEYVRGSLNIALRLIELSKELDKVSDNPTFVILHGLDFLLRENEREWLKFEESKVVVDEKKEQDFSKQKEELEKKSGVKASPLLNGFLSGIRPASPKQEKVMERFTYLDVLQALRKLYMKGSRSKLLLLVASESYLNINKVLLDNMRDIEKDIARYSIYGSFEMFKTKNNDNVPNANTAYVFNDTSASTVRLYNYQAKEASSWWEEINKYYKW